MPLRTFRLHGPDDNRPHSRARGYSRRWNRASRRFRAPPNHLCLHCQLQGKVTLATETDHIVPHRGDPVLFWDVNNWQPLCHSCHSAKTAQGE